MKLSKTENAKRTPPARMTSAVTNLDHLLQTEFRDQAHQAKPKARTRSVKQKANVDNVEPTTVIKACIDAGFGNCLYIRGRGAGLNWDKGIPLDCHNGSLWTWTSHSLEPIEFKLLLNDQIWAYGENVLVLPGNQIEVAPTFF